MLIFNCVYMHTGLMLLINCTLLIFFFCHLLDITDLFVVVLGVGNDRAKFSNMCFSVVTSCRLLNVIFN